MSEAIDNLKKEIKSKQQPLTARQRSGKKVFDKVSVLDIKPRDGYHGRWVNDLPGRIQMFKDCDWELVLEDGIRNFDLAESPIGNPIRKTVNSNPLARCKHAYWMEIPMEWWLENQEEKLKIINDEERIIDPKGVLKSVNRYGTVSINNVSSQQ